MYKKCARIRYDKQIFFLNRKILSSRITGRGGGLQNGMDRIVFIPSKRGGAEKVLVMLKGFTTSFGVVLRGSLKFSPY